MKSVRIRSVTYSPGYSDMTGGHHSVSLRQEKNGKWTYTETGRDDFMSDTVVKTYGVSAEAVADFEEFVAEKDVLSLSERPGSDIFATDYSPWSWDIGYSATSSENEETGFAEISEYREYTEKDRELTEELARRFTALRGELLSEKKRKGN